MKERGEKNLTTEIATTINAVASMLTIIVSIVAMIVEHRNCKKQIQESEMARIQQKEQFEETLKNQRQQYENEISQTKQVERIREQPYLVFIMQTIL